MRAWTLERELRWEAPRATSASSLRPMNEALQTLLDWEARHQLCSRNVLGYPVWPHLRFRRYHELLGSVLPADSGAQNARRRLWRRAPASARDLFTKLLPEARRRDIWVLASSAYRRAQPVGSPRNIFVGQLERQFGDRLLFLETNSTDAPDLDQANVVYSDLLRDALRIACARAARVLPERLAQPLASMPEVGRDARALLKEALFGRAWQRLARQLVAHAQPRAVFVLCAYDQHIPFQRAARQCGVPVIELQHGVIHENHPGYIFDAAEASGHTPDHLLVFGEHYGELVERASSYWSGRWSVGGHSWLSAKRTQFSGLEPEELVVIFGQNMPPVQRQVAACAARLRALLPRTVRIVVKPHPAERNAAECYAELSLLGVEIASARADSYELLGRCRMAVSVFSTIAVEAIAFGCQSVVLRSTNWFEDIQQAVEAGMLQVADGADEVAQIYQRSPRREQERLARRFFGVGAPDVELEPLIARLRAERAALGPSAPARGVRARTPGKRSDGGFTR
jgi:hypothetical protein